MTITANHSMVLGFNITHDADKRFGLANGISINASNCSIIGNSCWQTYIGIDCSYSEGNIIRNNTCVDNYKIGIKLYYCDRYVIENNNCTWNEVGIKLFQSHENTLVRNSCTYGIPEFLDGIGIDLDTSSENVISFNECFFNAFAGIVISRSREDLISGNNCSENNYGLYIDNNAKSNHRFVNNSVQSNNWTGVRMVGSSGMKFLNNDCRGNPYAVFMGGNCVDNDLKNNIVKDNSIGFFLENGADTNVFEDNFIATNERGVVLERSNFNEFISNSIRNNSDVGIEFETSDNNSLRENLFQENAIGIILQRHSRNNIAIVNFFYNNDEGVNASQNKEHSFDASSNYWGDDTGPYHPTRNKGGLGDSVTDFVIFIPWITANGSSINPPPFDNDADDENGIVIPSILAGILGIGFLGLAFRRENVRFLLLSLLTLPLYSRMERSDILDQSTRNDVYTQVVIQPGVNYSAIKSKLELGTSSLVYHLEVLEREGYIRSKMELGRKLFFPKGLVPVVDANANEQFAAAPLPPSPVQEKILDLLTENGPKTRTEIKDELSLKQQTVSYSIRSLEKRGLVKTGGKGKNNLCEIVEK